MCDEAKKHIRQCTNINVKNILVIDDALFWLHDVTGHVQSVDYRKIKVGEWVFPCRIQPSKIINTKFSNNKKCR